MIKTSLTVIVLMIQLWPFAASASSSCDHVLKQDKEALSQCIDDLNKEVERNRLEIQILKSQNTLISKQLCMVAIEQHRRNANSEALSLIVKDACAPFTKKRTTPEKSP